MDPNVTLNRLRELADDNDVEWANLFESLDDWLSKGGFLPSEWIRPEDSSENPTLTEGKRNGGLT